MKYLFIDESKAKDFLLCVVEIDASDVKDATKVVRSVKKKGQSTVHFVKESNSRRRQILSVYSKLDVKIKMFVAKGLSEGVSRQKCLEALILGLEPRTKYRIILDIDQTNFQRDRGVFIDFLPKKSALELISYQHEEPSRENLLWIPDAIAWSFARGGLWKQELEKFEIQTMQIS